LDKLGDTASFVNTLPAIGANTLFHIENISPSCDFGAKMPPISEEWGKMVLRHLKLF